MQRKPSSHSFNSSSKVRKLRHAQRMAPLAVFTAGALVIAAIIAHNVFAATITKNVGAGSLTTVPNASSWFFYNDETDVIDNSLGSFVTGPGTAPLGNGSAQISVSGTQRRNLATYQFGGTVLSTITTLKYSTYNPSAGNGGSANRSGFLTFNVDFNGSNVFQRRISYVPSVNGTVVQNTWQEWDAFNGGAALWLYSGATWPGTATPGTTARTWSDILTSYPGVRILPSDPWLGIRVGEPYADGYTENIDAFRIATGGNITEFNFDSLASTVYVNAAWAGTTPGADPDAGGPATSFGYDAFDTVKGGADGVAAGGTVNVAAGTYTLTATVNLNKNGVTIVGPGAKPVVQAASSIGNAFFVTGTGVTIQNLEIMKTNLADQDLIAVQGGNFTASNNLIYGPDPGMTWNAAGVVSRGFVISTVPNVNLLNNVIHHLRQPAYMSGSGVTGGNITGNQVSGTKGWVVEGGNFIFSGNTFGEPQNQSCDIALLASVAPLNNATYEPLLALSAANDNAFICQQYGALENGRATAYVDDGAAANGNGSDNANYNSINTAIAGTLVGGTVSVAAGTYNEDVAIGKTVKLSGAGPVGTTISGPIGGSSAATIAITANGVEVTGFTITRAGNNTTDWNNASLNTVGLAIQGQAITGALIHDNLFTGNRSGIDINNSNGHTIRNNVIDNNHTGLIFRNQTDNITFVENQVTNNRTVGVLFLDASGGTNTPVQTAANCTFFNNSISGNWYGEIVDRQSGGSLPAPGTTNLKNFSGNWLSSSSPVVTTANSAEPGYAALIPVVYGGSATDPGGQPDIAGPGSANFDYSPYLNAGTDSNVQTTPGRGTYGFQGSFNALNISATSAQTGGGSKIQEAIDLITAGGSLSVPTGTYPGSVNVNKALSINGTFTTSGGSFTTSAAGVVVSPGYSPGIITTGNLSFGTGTTVNVELNGVVAGTNYDQFAVTGTVTIASGVTLNPTIGYAPVAGDSYTIINNDGGDLVSGEFSGLPDETVFSVGANTLRIDYNGGDGNDVVLTNVSLCNAVSIPTNITSLTGGSPVASVNVDMTTGNGLLSTDFWLSYNPAVVTYASSTLGPVTSGGVLTVNSSTPGLLKISIFRSTPFTGAGSMVDITFNAVGLPGTSSPINFTQFKFNEGTPCISTSNGLITIVSGTITGTIIYGNPIGSPATRPVSAATLNAVGSVNVSAATNLSGVYSLSGMGSGPYTVTPTKTGGTNGAISGFDSSFIAQWVVGLISLNSTQLTVADVSGAGGVTSFDAALIARYVVALPGSGSAGNWVFTPANRGYANVNTNFSGEDYTAVLMGDVTGNWDTSGVTGGSRMAPSATKPIGISAGQVSVSRNSEVSLPVHIGDTTGKGIVAYQFDLTYDPAVLTPSDNTAVLAESLSRSMIATVNTETPGRLKVVVFGTLPINGEGVLLNLRFTAIGSVGTSTDLTWDGLMLNEGEGLYAKTSDGRVTVTEATPGQVSIDGALLTATGQGVPNTRVTLTGINGGSRTVMSNGFGFYEFGNVESGQTYTITVDGRRYTFTPVMVTASGNLAHVDLIAVP